VRAVGGGQLQNALPLGLGRTKACLRLLVGQLELAQPCGAGGPWSVCLRFVQLVALTRILGLRAQLVQVLD